MLSIKMKTQPPHIPNDRALVCVSGMLLLLALGCADFGSGTSTVKDEGCPVDNPTVSFASQVLPIFQANCGGSSCHFPCGPGNRLGICLASHETIMAAGIVIPGDAENSTIIKALEGRGVTPMPYERPSLADSLIQRVRTWIDECAPDN